VKLAWGAVLAVVATLTACARAPSVDPQAQQRLESVQADAQAAVEDVADLHVRIVRLERRLLRSQAAHRRLKRTSRAADKVLEKSVENLEAAAKELRARASAASDRGAEAAQVAAAAARDLTVLTRRFDYHLRHHGN
jgi:chromosome condensin MukBEF ATPase and DNA-binding subunit MukB